jgi:hypothetical protein
VRGKIYICPHRFGFRQIGQPQPEVAVYLRLLLECCLSEHANHAADFVEQLSDLIS